jgi:hypothetical protein
MTLTPARGRDYKSAKEAVKDFEDCKDFIMNDVIKGFGLCSISDFPAGTEITLRYNKLRNVKVIKVKK